MSIEHSHSIVSLSFLSTPLIDSGAGSKPEATHRIAQADESARRRHGDQRAQKSAMRVAQLRFSFVVNRHAKSERGRERRWKPSFLVLLPRPRRLAPPRTVNTSIPSDYNNLLFIRSLSHPAPALTPAAAAAGTEAALAAAAATAAAAAAGDLLFATAAASSNPWSNSSHRIGISTS